MKWIPSAFKVVARNNHLNLPKYTIDLLDGDFNCITTSPIFYDYKNLPSNYFPVGAIYARIGNKIPDNVQSFINNARCVNKKIVYFAVGSSGNKKFVIKILKNLLKYDFYIIAPVKTYFEDEGLSLVDDKLLCTGWLPADLISALVDFSVIHGGEGTVQTACQSGRPFIGFGLQLEQKINLSYCENYGNAISLKPSQVNSKLFSNALERIQLPTYLERAEQLRKIFKTNGTEIVANLIKDLVNKDSSLLKKSSY